MAWRPTVEQEICYLRHAQHFRPAGPNVHFDMAVLLHNLANEGIVVSGRDILTYVSKHFNLHVLDELIQVQLTEEGYPELTRGYQGESAEFHLFHAQFLDLLEARFGLSGHRETSPSPSLSSTASRPHSPTSDAVELVVDGPTAEANALASTSAPAPAPAPTPKSSSRATPKSTPAATARTPGKSGSSSRRATPAKRAAPSPRESEEPKPKRAASEGGTRARATPRKGGSVSPEEGLSVDGSAHGSGLASGASSAHATPTRGHRSAAASAAAAASGANSGASSARPSPSKRTSRATPTAKRAQLA